ncbi:hypothetical protein [Kordia jejudonensis]|uniref:hypothetical protein n=1 Tax=Kordia jejudonensis TaxID=1348245 RepID=UPI000629C4C3|nr:hypothetical protein [Kordia jejudonensis]
MLKSILNLKGVKSLNKSEQSTVKGSFGRCGVFTCTPESEGCPCYDNPNSADGVGCCMNGVCDD